MSPVIGADVPEQLMERIDDHKPDGRSRSAAMRRMIRSHLDRIEPDPPLIRLGNSLRALSAACLLLWIASQLPTIDLILYIGMISLFGSLTIRFYHGPPLRATLEDQMNRMRGG